MKVPVRRHEPLRGDDSMTPLIDVVFLLLIFFVCASVGQVAESLLPTELAAAGGVESAVASPEEVPPPPAQVWLRARNEAGRISFELEGRQCGSFEELSGVLRTLAELSAESPLVLDVGPEVPLEVVVDVWDVANRAGFESINFATPPQSAMSQ